MKRNRKMLALAAATMLTVSSSPMAFGVDGTVYSTKRDDSSVETTKLDKYLVMKKDANVPAATFDFTIAPISETAAIAGDTEHGKLAVLPGVDGARLYVGESVPEGGASATFALNFTPNDTVIEEGTSNTDTPVFVTTDDPEGEKTSKSSDEKYVKKSITIDFANVLFTEPGVYRYTITESGNNLGVLNGYTGTTIDGTTTTINTEDKRTLDVYVENDDSTDSGKPMLKITKYAMYDGVVNEAPFATAVGDDPATLEVDESDSKVDGATKNASITNIYGTQNLTFAKVVTGNQGSKDKYFKFEVSLTHIKALGTTFTANVTKGAEASVPTSVNAATNSGFAGKINPASLVVENEKIVDANDAEKIEETVNTYGYYIVSDGEGANKEYTIKATYYLQSGQYITINGLSRGILYRVLEDAEDYTSDNSISASLSPLNYDGQEGNDAFTDNFTDTIDDSDIHTGYTNDRSGAIPTGIIASIAGPIILVGVGVVGVIVAFICIKKKKSEEEN